jgi:hypothetical protein
VAGSAGTAVFRSLQDRMLAVLNGAKAETLANGIEALDAELESAKPQALEAATADQAKSAAADLQARTAELRGQVRALLRVAGRR